jgi:hypothetical protein
MIDDEFLTINQELSFSSGREQRSFFRGLVAKALTHSATLQRKQ